MAKKKLKNNKATGNNRVLIQCATVVDKSAVTREVINGVEHVIVSSFTLPDNIVMNGGLYPADEIANSFKSLERTLAPIEHPHDVDGNFISASDPDAIHNFHAGAFNVNVTQENGRIHIEKHINVPEAMKTDRGRRLLDRINEIETNDSPRAIHTSTGIFLEVEETKEIMTNADGAEYNWIARNMVFDHDAILLDSIGAAQPNQGVGMAINSDGEETSVQTFMMDNVDFIATPPEDELSHEEIRDLLHDAINVSPIRGDWIVRVFNAIVIFELDNQLFSAPYLIENGIARIVGIPLTVERDETFTPKVNQKGDDMKEAILLALNAANIETKDLDDDQLLAAYNELQANQFNSDDENASNEQATELADVVANALKPLVDKIDGLEQKVNQKDDDELTQLAEIVGNSDNYKNLDADQAKILPLETLKAMAANCQTSTGVPGGFINNDDGSDDAAVMPD